MTANIPKKTRKTIGEKKTISEGSLDKLAQLSPPENENTLLSLRKRAKAKFFTNSYTRALASLKSPLQKSYNNTIFGCANLLKQTDNKITGSYCNNRWCVVCNRIRTAKLINGYQKSLDELPDKHFVTLTIPNVSGQLLGATILLMIKKFTNLRKYLHKKGIKIVGLRKIECTYNPITNTFHPHFHLIVSTRMIAEIMQQEWLKRYPDAKEIAQDIRPAENGYHLELFKYFTKIISKDAIYISALDCIFQSMKGLRVFQSMGIKKVTEEIEELQSQTIEDLKEAEKTWTWLDNDWIDYETGELLTNYKPEESMLRLIKEKLLK